MHKIKEKLKEELKMLEKQIEKKDQMSAGDLELLHKLSDTLKNLDKIGRLESAENGYSERSDWLGEGKMYGVSYARDGRGRGRNAKRDSMGRYSSDGGYSYDDDSSYERGGRNALRGGYSREGGMSYNDGKDYMIEQIEDMMQEADPKSREALKRCIKQIENA